MPPRNRTTQDEDVVVAEPATPVVEQTPEVEEGLEEPTFDKQPEPVRCLNYVGPASRRVITVEEFKTLGSEIDHDIEWNLGNDMLVPLSEFDEPALKYLRTDGRFVAAERNPAEAEA